jgi:hypothetical protein
LSTGLWIVTCAACARLIPATFSARTRTVAATLTLRLAPFEREALDAYGASQQVPPERVVLTAVLYYLREQHSKRETWPVPAFRRGEPDNGSALQVELGKETGQALATQAAAQCVRPESLGRHALLFFLADVDSGEVASTLESMLRDA